jgi:DNA integrity scanning protein DisA with diadenylate cyclase activity
MELQKDCQISIAQVEVENISLILGISKKEVVESMLVQIGFFVNKLKPKFQNQKSFHKTFYISNEKKDAHFKLKAVFHTKWWRDQDKNKIGAVIVSSPQGVTKKYIFNAQDIQSSISVSLEKSIFGEQNV